MGIIPARAGFTARSPLTGLTWRDHPRSRGVYLAGPQRIPMAQGSSPLARGLRGTMIAGRDRRGIIPARAGFT